MSTPATVFRGSLCSTRGHRREAPADCDRAVSLDAGDPRPRYNRALLLAALGRTREAVAELRRVLQDHPGYAPARAALGASPP
jgi:Flp pilus assembly protein TadD